MGKTARTTVEEATMNSNWIATTNRKLVSYHVLYRPRGSMCVCACECVSHPMITRLMSLLRSLVFLHANVYFFAIS